MKKKYNVVIVGAGPSGLATALSLVDEGINDVLVLEKYQFPRYKCCAGYVTNKTKKAYLKFGLDLEKCHYSLIRDFKIFYNYELKQKIKNIFLYTNRKVDRVELDYQFYLLAKSKKIEILEGVHILEVDKENNFLMLSNNKKITYQHLVLADGTGSILNKTDTFKKKNIAMQITFPTKKEEEIQIHFGVTKRGYAWISSYGGVLNVGITDVYNPKTNYKKIMEEFLKKEGFSVPISELRGAFTPIGVRKQVVLDNNIYFVGDAAGLCDPLTLSGLRYALDSGRSCAKAIALKDNRYYLKYVNKVKRKFFLMQILQKVFYLKAILFLIFNVGCRFFKGVIAFCFNNFFVSKK